MASKRKTTTKRKLNAEYNDKFTIPNKALKVSDKNEIESGSGSKSKYFADAADRKNISSTSKSAGDTVHNAKDRLLYPFFDLPCEDLAKALIGQKLVTIVDGQRKSGVIVETEAYLGPDDKAAHSHKGKRTDRNEAMFMPPGTSYVYNIYGMYCCMNISSQVDGAAVLLRALEPTENLSAMSKLRTANGKDPSLLLKKDGKGLCNGPSKLCQALGIKKTSFNQVDLCTSTDIWLEKGEAIDSSKIVECKRINIDYAEDWVDKPLRFYILGNNFVSVRDKDAEKRNASVA